VFAGKLDDGSEVDVLRPGEPLSWDAPRALPPPDDRWDIYRWRLWEKSNAALRPYYGRYLCRHWNDGAAPGRRLQKFSMTWVQEFPAPDAPARIERAVGGWQDCANGGAEQGA
jgi:hypothetical protein